MSPSLAIILLFLGFSFGAPIDSPVNEDASLLLEDDKADETRIYNQEESNGSSSNYNFGFSIIDGISDSTIERTETRENNRVTGAYSYTDGFIKQTVVYVADEFGFRVIDMNTEEIGQGPVRNESGTAIVQSYVDGVETNYAIQSEPEDPLNHPDGRVIFKS